MTAWTTARLSPGIGTTTRSSRWGGGDDLVGPDRELRAVDAAYWRLMNSISADEDRDEDDDEVRAVENFTRRDDDQDDQR